MNALEVLEKLPPDQWVHIRKDGGELGQNSAQRFIGCAERFTDYELSYLKVSKITISEHGEICLHCYLEQSDEIAILKERIRTLEQMSKIDNHTIAQQSKRIYQLAKTQGLL